MILYFGCVNIICAGSNTFSSTYTISHHMNITLEYNDVAPSGHNLYSFANYNIQEILRHR